MMSAGVMSRAACKFPASIAEFQWFFSDDAACVAWLERLRWPGGFVCPHCGEAGEPIHFPNRPEFLHCRTCGCNVSLAADTVMAGAMTPISVWFLAAYLVAENAQGINAKQFCSRLGLERYDIAVDILHKLRDRLRDEPGGRVGRPLSHDRVEVEVEWVDCADGTGGKALAAVAVEVLYGGNGMHWGGQCAGRLILRTIPDHTPETLCAFVENAVWPGSGVAIGGLGRCDRLAELGYRLPADGGVVAGTDQTAARLVFDNLKGWLREGGGDVASGFESRLDEFAFRFNRCFDTFAIFRSLLGINSVVATPIYREIGSGDWKRSGCGA
jgi:hypothetical protein